LSKAISFGRSTASRTFAVFCRHSPLGSGDQNRQGEKTFGIGSHFNDKAATAPGPFEIWGVILSGKMPDSRFHPQRSQIREFQPKDWYNGALAGGVDL
jgi:hypothetical protein